MGAGTARRMELLFGYREYCVCKEVTRLSYIEKVLSRLNIPGLILLIAGAVAVFASEGIVEKISPEKKDKANLIFKTAGLIAALAGVLILLDVIG